jgi:hypothetical protein
MWLVLLSWFNLPLSLSAKLQPPLPTSCAYTGTGRVSSSACCDVCCVQGQAHLANQTCSLLACSTALLHCSNGRSNVSRVQIRYRSLFCMQLCPRCASGTTALNSCVFVPGLQSHLPLAALCSHLLSSCHVQMHAGSGQLQQQPAGQRSQHGRDRPQTGTKHGPNPPMFLLLASLLDGHPGLTIGHCTHPAHRSSSLQRCQSSRRKCLRAQACQVRAGQASPVDGGGKWVRGTSRHMQ